MFNSDGKTTSLGSLFDLLKFVAVLLGLGFQQYVQFGYQNQAIDSTVNRIEAIEEEVEEIEEVVEETLPEIVDGGSL